MDPGALSDDLSFLLARANALSVSAGNAALAPLGLRVRSYSVLALAVGEAGLSQRELADVLRLDPSQVVALVDDLQSRGLVERTTDPDDRRTKAVVATGSGRDLYVRARQAAAESERSRHAALTDDERMLLTDLLRRVAFPG